jgi:hypothetical protein
VDFECKTDAAILEKVPAALAGSLVDQVVGERLGFSPGFALSILGKVNWERNFV